MHSRRQPRSRFTAFAFIAPAAIFFAVFLMLPVMAVFALAFTQWSGFDVSQLQWVGLDNFSELKGDGIFWRSLWHTVIFVAFSTVLLNAFGLAAALLINTRVAGHDFLRVAMFLPLGLSPVVTALLWQQLIGPYGFFNQLLVQTLDIRSTPIGFLGDQQLALATVIGASVWQFCGIDMLLYYAALQNLPKEHLEAASIDGAGSWSRFRWITIPYLRPIIAVTVVLNLIGGWKVFDLVYVLTRGGPDRATEVMSTYLYQQAFEFSRVGYASGIAIVIVALATLSVLARGRIAGETA